MSREPGMQHGGSGRLLSAQQEVWRRAAVSVLCRVETIQRAVSAFAAGGLDEQQRAEAEREAHKLAGSAGTFGFHGISRFARGRRRG